jgi:hypothetical protein
MLWIETYHGDLCRIGGYRENDYGWNLPQKRFKDCHYTIGKNLSDYDKYYDIVTIGDSFSVNEKQSWQNHLALTTGAKILTFHRRSVTASSLLQHEQFIKTPPKVFIFQVVENGIQTALFDVALDEHQLFHNEDSKSIKAFDKKKINYDKHIEAFSRGRNQNFSMDSAIHHIKTNLKQLFGSRLKAKPYKLKSDKKLFSNNKQNEALFYYLDNLKLSISSDEWAIIEKRFATLQHQTQANGKTRFLAMIVPDKTTAYADFIKDINPDYKSSLSFMPKRHDINWINLEEKFKERLSSKEAIKDLYLPNDTHWGYEGYKLAFHSTFNSIVCFSMANE